jgi:hypothetical protein
MMDDSDAGGAPGVQAEARMRELWRAAASFLSAVEEDPAFNSRTRLAAAGVAAALQQATAEWSGIARDWRQLRQNGHDVQYHLLSIERQVGELYRLVQHEEEWPTLL